MKKFASILLSMLMATGAIAAASAETYTGTAQGIGEVSVTLTVEDGKITAAEVVGESETKGIGYEPCADGTFADAIVAAQGVDFDSISGATVTSNAVKDAAKKAMPIASNARQPSPGSGGLHSGISSAGIWLGRHIGKNSCRNRPNLHCSCGDGHIHSTDRR